MKYNKEIGGSEKNAIISQGRSVMKVYAAHDYVDAKHRRTNTVQVNIPEYTPTVPQDDEYTEIALDKEYFENENYPVTQEIVKSSHYVELPLLKGSYAPIRFNKGTEFLLIYPTGKIEEGFLMFMFDRKMDNALYEDGAL